MKNGKGVAMPPRHVAGVLREIKNAAEAARETDAIEGELNRLFPQRIIRRILFVVPPDGDARLFDFATAKRGRYWNYPPYGFGILASCLREDGISVRILNLNNEVLRSCRNAPSQAGFDFDASWKTALDDAIDSFAPDLIGLTCMFSQTHAMAVQVCGQIKTRRPDSVTAIGGVHVTNCFLHRKMFETVARDFAGADLFFLFEAESAFRNFVAVVNGSAPAAGLYQVYFNTPPAKVYFSVRKTPTKKELDVIPAYDLMGVEHLAENGVIGSFTCLKSDHRRYGTVLSNRGCRGRCTYCSVRNFNGPGVRCRSVSSIIEELRMMREQFGIDHIMWLDDDLLFDHRRAIRLFTEMIRQDIGITWDCTNGVIAASCTDEIIAAAEESGCIGMNIGVESGNPEVLKRIRKPGTLEDFLNAAAVFKRHERINARVFLMIGFPEETYRMILDTYALAVRMDLDWYNITTLQPLPNTPIFDSMLQQGLVTIPDPTQVRYNSGPYGKKRELMIRHRLPEHFKNPFDNVDLAAVPPPSEHEAIWLYLNYHLNFKPLFGLHHPVKLQQRLKYLRYITEQVAPDDPFPVYFYGLLQHRINGKTDGALVSRLEGILESSGYWRNCFRYFRLAPSQLSGGAIPAEATI